MIVTGRAGLVALAGGLVVLAFRTGAALFLVDLVIVVAIIVDVTLAASVRKLQITRSGDSKVHLGQAGAVQVTITNAGRRRLHAVVRDGWRPSAGASPARHAVRLRPGRRVSLSTALTPTRRGDVSAGAVTVRSLGPLGLAGLAGERAGAVDSPGAARFPQPQAPAGEARQAP